MELRILGPIEVVSDGRQVRLGGPRQRALLAYLLLHANGAVPTERLLERLWDEPPTGGLAALQTQIYRLRRLLGDRIETSGHGYSIRVGPGELDLDVFRALLAEAGASADPAARSRLLREADALWRGEPLAGVDAPFARAEAAALDELRLSVLEDRLEADLERGCDGELVAELRVLVEEHPLRERLRGELILALYRSGRQAEALEAYRDTRRMLDDELGLEPSPALRELERAILRHDPALEPAVAATAPAPGRKRRAAWLVLAGAGLALAGVAGAAAVVLTDVAGSKRAAPGPTVRIVTVRTSEPSRRARTRVRPRVHHVHAAVRPAAPAAIVHVVTSAAATTTTTTATHAAPPATASTTTAPVKRTVSKPPPTPVTISDTFDGSQIDNTIWYQISEGSGWTLAQNDGQLEFAFPPDSQRGGQWDTFGGHIGTQCRFPGEHRLVLLARELCARGRAVRRVPRRGHGHGLAAGRRHDRNAPSRPARRRRDRVLPPRRRLGRARVGAHDGDGEGRRRRRRLAAERRQPVRRPAGRRGLRQLLGHGRRPGLPARQRAADPVTRSGRPGGRPLPSVMRRLSRAASPRRPRRIRSRSG